MVKILSLNCLYITDMFIANPSDPKTYYQLLRALNKLSCQDDPILLELFSNEKTPIFMCGAKAKFSCLVHIQFFDFNSMFKILRFYNCKFSK